MTHLAVLGTGLLGTGVAENLLTKDHAVHAWNRTTAKAAPLADKGAVIAESAADAVRGATHVHLVLSEDDAVDAVIRAMRPGLGVGVPVIDHSTNSPKKVAARYEALRADNVRYVSAPMFMSPDDARGGTGMIVLSAPSTEAAEMEAHLGQMTSHVLNAGERPDLAAVYKLAGNSMYFALTAAMSDVLAIGEGCDVPAREMIALFKTFKVGGALPYIGKHLASPGDSPATFELAMARKDTRLIEEATGPNPTIILSAIAAAMDRTLAKGATKPDFSSFAKR